MNEPKSWLFVPGDSEKKMGKAIGGEADAIILDLEDSVAASNKQTARDITAAALAGERPDDQQFWVRINPLDSGLAEGDCDAICAASFDGIMLPKSECGDQVAQLSAMLDEREADGVKIIALVTETPQSLFGAGTYRGSSERLAALTWGAEDLSSALGASAKHGPDGELDFTYKLARSLCLAGAVAAGVQPVDSVYPDFRDIDGFTADCERSRREGFTGMMAIHPAQVPIINAAFTPNDEEIVHAEAIVQAFRDNPDAGTIGLDGKMIDRPHLVQAQRLLKRAGSGGAADT